MPICHVSPFEYADQAPVGRRTAQCWLLLSTVVMSSWYLKGSGESVQNTTMTGLVN